jgi:hypothetical protein
MQERYIRLLLAATITCAVIQRALSRAIHPSESDLSHSKV